MLSGWLPSALAQPAFMLDPVFKPVITQAGGRIESVVVGSDGKIYIAGWFDAIDGILRPGLARLNGDGSLDTSFAPEGSTIAGLALQRDGQLIVGAACWVIRLRPDGSMDQDFHPAWPGELPSALAVQDDGRILVGGRRFDRALNLDDTIIVRFNTDGSLDPTFSLATLNQRSGENWNGIVIQADGKIVVWGYFTGLNGTDHRGLARLNADGSLDSSFKHSIPPVNSTNMEISVTSVALLRDGKLIVGGYFDAAGHGLVRLNSDGSLDSTFRVRDPRVSWAPGQLIVQADGKVTFWTDRRDLCVSIKLAASAPAFRPKFSGAG